MSTVIPISLETPATQEAARVMGGLGLHVGRDFTAGPDQVRAWLARAARHLAPEATDVRR